MIGPVDLSEIQSLAPMPASVGRLASMVSDPEVNMGDVARVIQFDQALTVKTLRLANSAWSGSRQEIDSVKQAVMRLGSARILELIVGEQVSTLMKQPCQEYELGGQELWSHSVAAALAAEHLGAFASRPVPGSAFTAALLHDVGKLVLARHVGPDAIEEIRRAVESDQILYIEAERRSLDTDHAAVGGAVARQWQFPDVLVQAIEQHHDPDVEPNPVLDTVHVANLVAKLIGVGLGADQMNLKASEEAPSRLGMDRPGLEGLCAGVADELAKAEERYGSSENGH